MVVSVASNHLKLIEIYKHCSSSVVNTAA